jgi:hypothetical protein
MHDEAVLTPSFFGDSQEKVAPLCRLQLRLPTIATTGYKMQILVAVVPNEPFGHPVRVTTRMWSYCDPDTSRL